ERYGLVQHTLDLSRRCARDGFMVVTPNFFFRHHDPVKLNQGEGRYDMSDPESLELVDAAFDIARADPCADMARIAIAGYCQTGRHPLVYAAQRRLNAAIVWYGACSKREWETNERQPHKLEEIIARLECPVFGAFGEADHIISIQDVLRFRKSLEDAGKSYDLHIYEGAPHGWLNDTMPGRYRAPQALAGWADQQAFLGKVMAPEYRRERIEWRFESAHSFSYDFSKNVRLE
ncbi:MAG: dienelactone hydrolase family protein, partial [Alphaproteobacteria bacterium]|nr:dienelactone hydrolase family protein [Alphaproteobacteria bacterium]